MQCASIPQFLHEDCVIYIFIILQYSAMHQLQRYDMFFPHHALHVRMFDFQDLTFTIWLNTNT